MLNIRKATRGSFPPLPFLAIVIFLSSSVKDQRRNANVIIMFSLASRVARPVASNAARCTQYRGFAQTVKEGLTATDAWNKSCYSDIDYTINENLPVYEAVQKFAAYNVGCLVTVDGDGEE